MSTADLLLRMKAAGADQVAGEMRQVNSATGGLASNLLSTSQAAGALGEKTIGTRQGLAQLNTESGKASAGVNTVGTAAEHTGSKLTGMGKAMIAVFSVAALRQLGQWGTQLYNIGMQSEAMGLRYRAVFGDMTRELDRWVVAHQNSFGVAKDDLQGYVAQTANMLTPMGATIEQAGIMSETILEVANAWSIWSGGQYTVTDASDRVVKGLMGQTRGLVDMGMKITEAQISQEMLRLGTDKLTGTEKDLAEVQARLNLIVAASGPAFGVAEEALNGAAGGARDLGSAWAGLMDTLGGKAASGAGANIASIGAGLMNTFSWMLGNEEPMRGAWGGWMSHSSAAELAAEMADWQAEVAADLAANPMNIPQQVRNALIEQMYGIAGGAPDPTALRTLFTSLAAALPGQATELANLFRTVIGDSLPDWTPPHDVMIQGAEVMAARLAAAFPPKIVEHLSSGEIHRRIVEAMGEQLVNPIHQAFLVGVREVDKGFDNIGNAFVKFELPDITIEDIATNLADWQQAQDDVDAMLAALGDHGLDAFATALMSGLSSAQLAAIAAVWGGDLSALYALLPEYGPGGGSHPGASNPPIQIPVDDRSRGGGGGGGDVPVQVILGEADIVGLIEERAIRTMGRGGRSNLLAWQPQ